jgi:hypothetical protein
VAEAGASTTVLVRTRFVQHYWHCPAGPSHVDGCWLFPALFAESVVVVHPGLPLQVLSLPPWVVVVVVTNPFFSPAASAAVEANANEATTRRAEISRVMVSSFID